MAYCLSKGKADVKHWYVPGGPKDNYRRKDENQYLPKFALSLRVLLDVWGASMKTWREQDTV